MKYFLFGNEEEIIGSVIYRKEYRYKTIRELLYSCIKDEDINQYLMTNDIIIELSKIDDTSAKITKIIPTDEWYAIYKKMLIIS